jgi:hypothetical protein
MAALSTVIAGAALGLGAASAVSQKIAADKQRKAQNKANQKQATAVREANRLKLTKAGTGAEIVFGTSKASDELLRRGRRGKSKTKPDKSDIVGGL